MSIEFIIKRDGSKEEFQPQKLNGWGEWATSNLDKFVDWGEAVLHAYSVNKPETTSEELQLSLIDFCLNKQTFAYNRMAGRLYVALLYKRIYNQDKPPTLREVHSNLVNHGLMSEDFYNSFSKQDYEELEKIINHKRDLTYTHYQLDQILDKYSLHDRVNNIYFEMPQFVYMRVAMRMCQNKGTGKQRIDRIKRHYAQYSNNTVNIPTPYFTNSRNYS